MVIGKFQDYVRHSWSFCQIFIIFYYTNKYIVLKPTFLYTSEWSKLSCACQLQHTNTSLDNGASDDGAVFNSLSTINPHYHVKYSWLNHIVKRNVKIDPYIGKIKWLQILFLPRWQHKSKINQFMSLSCYLEATDSLPFKTYVLLVKIQFFFVWKVDYWLHILTFKTKCFGRQHFIIWRKPVLLALRLKYKLIHCKSYNNQSLTCLKPWEQQ
jgi:hypothetical protein